MIENELYIQECIKNFDQDDWFVWSCGQNLPEYDIHAFRDYVDWEQVLKNTTKLSEQFLREHLDYIKRDQHAIKAMVVYQDISIEFKRELKEMGLYPFDNDFEWG